MVPPPPGSTVTSDVHRCGCAGRGRERSRCQGPKEGTLRVDWKSQRWREEDTVGKELMEPLRVRGREAERQALAMSEALQEAQATV